MLNQQWQLWKAGSSMHDQWNMFFFVSFLHENLSALFLKAWWQQAHAATISTTFSPAHLKLLFFLSRLFFFFFFCWFQRTSPSQLHTNVSSRETYSGFHLAMTLTWKSDSGDSDSDLDSPPPSLPPSLPPFPRPCITISHFLCVIYLFIFLSNNWSGQRTMSLTHIWVS